MKFYDFIYGNTFDTRTIDVMHKPISTVMGRRFDPSFSWYCQNRQNEDKKLNIRQKYSLLD